jgi:hypothetical protein
VDADERRAAQVALGGFTAMIVATFFVGMVVVALWYIGREF